MPTLFCITDSDPPVTRELLRSACLRRSVRFVNVATQRHDFSAPRSVHLGDIVYRSATSTISATVEQQFMTRGAVGFGSGRAANQAHAIDLMRQGGVPVIESVLCHGRDRGMIRRAVEAVGGPPVVVKVPGGEGGIGVMLAETTRSLHSILDHLHARGVTPMLSAFIDHATHWRCLVLDGKPIAGYRQLQMPDDFRSYTSDDPTDFAERLPVAVAAVSTAACSALGLDFAGVDVLVDPSGTTVVLEANMPCYFAPAELLGKVDVSGLLVEALLART